jgi:hypothetical protein
MILHTIRSRSNNPKLLFLICFLSSDLKLQVNFSLNNVYVEGSSILLLKNRQVRSKMPELVARDSIPPESRPPESRPQRVEAQRFDLMSGLPDPKSVARDSRPPERVDPQKE